MRVCACYCSASCLFCCSCYMYAILFHQLSLVHGYFGYSPPLPSPPLPSPPLPSPPLPSPPLPSPPLPSPPLPSPPLPSPLLPLSVKRTLTLAKLTQWLAEGRYCRLDKLQSDLLALLHRAREGRGTQSQVLVCLSSNFPPFYMLDVPIHVQCNIYI